MSSPPYFRRYHEGLTVFIGMKSPLRASCSQQTCDPCPGLAVRFPDPYTSPMGLDVLPQRPGQLLVLRLRTDRYFLYSVFITPISVPQCLHFIIKSGHRPFIGEINCTFVFKDVSINLYPHLGHRMERLFFSNPLICTSFFFCISYKLLSWPLSGNQVLGVYDLFYLTSSVSQGAIGLDITLAFKYAISSVRQVLPK